MRVEVFIKILTVCEGVGGDGGAEGDQLTGFEDIF